MSDQDAIKAQLEQELRAATPDLGEVVSLAHKLANASSDFVRFTVDASHISRLGLELVSKQETAVSELVKNAFDADALTVDVIFKSSDAPGGSMEIIDSGLGMSREQLRDGFMRLSTVDKVKQPFSPKYGRKRAGRKGIGRFATQRLGRRLRVETQQPDATFSLHLEIDWDRFEAGLDLHTISNQIVVAEAKPTPGTMLVISDLRDAWSEAQIRRAFRYVSELLQPFPLDRKSPQAVSKADPGFKAAFYKETAGDLVQIASEETLIFPHAVAKLTATVGEDGRAIFTVLSDTYKISLHDQLLPTESRIRSRVDRKDGTYPLIKNVQLSAYYFISDELPSGVKGMVRDVLTNTGGIRVYRNGFRVLPYGDTFDDWLGLQRSSALRQVLPPHHNTNFIGFVEIVDHEGKRFEETASREGLVENEAFKQLQDFVYRALISSVIEVAKARGRKVFASDPSPKRPDPNEEPRSPREKAEEVANKLRDIASSKTANSPSGVDENAQAIVALAATVEEIGSESEQALQEVGMLRVLASLGLTIGEFTHEVRHALVALSASIDELFRDSQGNDQSQVVVEHVALLRSYMRYFDDAVAHNADRALSVHELRDVVNEFLGFIRPSLRRQNIAVDVQFNGYDLFTRPMHKSEWASILLNLCTNSLKAIHRAGVVGRISIEAGVLDEMLYIDFSDNGDGIAIENRERVFEAFYTTSAPGSALSGHAEQLMGTGLGLKIIRDIVEAIGGYIEVIDSLDGYSTRFRVCVPRAREEQIGDARY